jgi:3-deoxy-D-manno-octulosonic-acid transferase
LAASLQPVPPTSPIYRTAARVAVPLVPLLLRSDRQRAAHAARIAAPAAMATWAQTWRDRARPLAWFHAPSVGEGLQARAVIEVMRTRHPDLQVVYTHYSPSATVLAASIGADHAGYLPYDRRGDVEAALDAVAPDLLVFTKLDLWPELAARASMRGTQTAMIAATVLPDSGRLGWMTRRLAAPGYASLDAIGAVSAADAERMTRLGVPASRVTVTGDPRIDSVLGVADRVDREQPSFMLTNETRTLVAGSTWPDDERVLVRALQRVLAARADARLVIAPHEPDDAHLGRLEADLDAASLTHVRLSALTGRPDASVIVVDRVGLLARLYRAGELAYVGGGWGRAGLHSVLEPAAWGRPVWVGPHDRGSRDAALLRDHGGLLQLVSAGASEHLAESWIALLDDHDERRRLGVAARAALEPERGAATRSADLLDALLSRAGVP